MKKQLFFAALCLMPIMANAEIIYRVEKIKAPVSEATTSGNRVLAAARPFYIGGSYNHTMWQDYTTDTNIVLDGKNSSSFDIVAGLRLYDTFRLEANYINTTAKWDTLSFESHIAMLNFIWDARIDHFYRLFKSQMLVPYVGFGAGAAWNKGENGATMNDKISPIASAMAGISVEFNTIFALDFGYKYLYMFNGDSNVIPDLDPTAHQFRVGARLHF
ncbi:MAG: porin family protein [Alphaproteobacteria bacterium]|jgi:opacity protein-like surface antigen|nr:porin family protein [Alphaproteobacteria bacterium]